MASHPIHINDQWVTIAGEVSNPRFVWIFDRVGLQLARDSEGYGFDSRDQIAVFSVGTFSNVRAFLDLRQFENRNVKSFIFMMLGQDELAYDAPPSGFNEIVEGWFHHKGPRQVMTGKDNSSIMESYEALVDLALDRFPKATLFTTEPAMRRSGFGFAVKLALRVGRLQRRDKERHHHMLVGCHLYGRRRGKKTGLGDGGLLPIKEDFFEDNGVMLKKTAFLEILRRVRSAIDATLLPHEDPNSIEGLTFMY